MAAAGWRLRAERGEPTPRTFLAGGAGVHDVFAEPEQPARRQNGHSTESDIPATWDVLTFYLPTPTQAKSQMCARLRARALEGGRARAISPQKRADWPAGSSLVPPRHPQALATTPHPRPVRAGWTPFGSVGALWRDARSYTFRWQGFEDDGPAQSAPQGE